MKNLELRAEERVAVLFPASGARQGEGTCESIFGERPRKAWPWGSVDLRTSAVVGVIALLVTSYLLYLLHFEGDELASDDWTVVPLVHAALQGHLSLGALWALHNDNRMFIPNLMFIGTGVLTHDRPEGTILLSGAVFVLTFLLYLRAFRTYVHRPLSPLSVLALGIVWFSLADWQNALWAFQLAWYLILMALVAMIWLLSRGPERRLVLVGAISLAVAASVSSSQGLLLWPVGLVCLLWSSSDSGGDRRHATAKVVAAWSTAAVLTTTLYLWGYRTSAPTGISAVISRRLSGFNWSSDSVSFGLHHPLVTLRFLLVMIGNVVPINTDPSTTWSGQLIGGAICAIGIFVVVRSCRNRHFGDRLQCLPVAMIAFGLLFGIEIALGRVQLGIASGALLSRYTMAGLPIVVGIVTYAMRELPVRRSQPVARVVLALLSAFLLFQFATATDHGLSQSAAYQRSLDVGARIVVNDDRIPPDQRTCYALYGLLVYHAPDLNPAVAAAMRRDQLSVFRPADYSYYRAQGLPRIRAC
jgi:hypothetical protein